MTRLILFWAIVLATFAPAALAQNALHRPDGPIFDQAEIIDPDAEAQLDQRLRNYSRDTGRSVIVATVNSLDNEPIDTFTRDLAEKWQIGGAETEEGVLMLVAPNEREVWITTARGVQGTLTDISTGRIIRNTIVPEFKNGNYPGGIAAGVEKIIERLDLDPVQAQALAEAEAPAERTRDKEGGLPIGALIWFAAIFFFFILPMMRRGGKRRRGSSAIGDIILWEVGSAIARGAMNGGSSSGSGGFSGGFGGFGGGGGGFNGGGAGGSW